MNIKVRLDFPLVKKICFPFNKQIVVSEVDLRWVTLKDMTGIDFKQDSGEIVKLLIPRISNLSKEDSGNLAISDFIKISLEISKMFEPRKTNKENL